MLNLIGCKVSTIAEITAIRRSRVYIFSASCAFPFRDFFETFTFPQLLRNIHSTRETREESQIPRGYSNGVNTNTSRALDVAKKLHIPPRPVDADRPTRAHFANPTELARQPWSGIT